MAFVLYHLTAMHTQLELEKKKRDTMTGVGNEKRDTTIMPTRGRNFSHLVRPKLPCLRQPDGEGTGRCGISLAKAATRPRFMGSAVDGLSW